VNGVNIFPKTIYTSGENFDSAGESGCTNSLINQENENNAAEK
jgi:hypothetical protein